MFSSNQVLEISGDLGHINDLKDALEYALKKSGWHECFTRAEKPAKCCFQITEYGDYCIGWFCERGWTEFQFDYDIDVISKIIVNHLKKQDVQSYNSDGSNSKGYLMKSVEYNSEGVKEPFYGIVKFSAYNCYYAK